MKHITKFWAYLSYSPRYYTILSALWLTLSIRACAAHVPGWETMLAGAAFGIMFTMAVCGWSTHLEAEQVQARADRQWAKISPEEVAYYKETLGRGRRHR